MHNHVTHGITLFVGLKVLEGIGANREIAARILFEKPVKAKELGIELRHEGPKPSKLDKYVRWLDTLLSNGITT